MKRTAPLIPSTLAVTAWLSLANAQETGPQATTPPVELEEIVVVGSNIRNSDLNADLPVSVFTAADLQAIAPTTAEDLIQSLPFSGGMEFNSSTPSPNKARGDVAGVNLRGLGSGNTLVLMNGRRLARSPAGQLIDDVPVQTVNVNVIPVGGIGRVELLRDGASALYGSDAVAGVVNFVTDRNHQGLTVSSQFLGSESTSQRETNLDVLYGTSFNEGRTHLTLGANWFSREAMKNSETAITATADRRSMAPRGFENDAQLNNMSAGTPYGEYQAGRFLGRNFAPAAVRRGTTSLTNSTGIFHVQPQSEAGALAPTGQAGIFVDDGSQTLRYDFTANAQIVPDSDRLNLSFGVTHELDSGVSLFADGLYYRSASENYDAEQSFDNGNAFVVVPASNYWNPFGAATLPDGSPNPNRIAGINAPPEGLDVLVRQFRVLELGSRKIEVDSNQYHAVFGARGASGNWDWESAGVVSRAEHEDRQYNRVSKTALSRLLDDSTPGALNVFGGPNVNSNALLDAIRVTEVNQFETALYSVDARVSNASLWSMWGGDAGIAAGLEWRREELSEDRDPRRDGTIPFVDETFGITDGSDIAGLPPVADSKGSRNIASAYTELALPLVGAPNRIAGVWSLETQIAARFEDYSDFGSLVKPKLGLAWRPIESLLVRASAAEGFQAPNLLLTSRGESITSRSGLDDIYRSQVTRDPEDAGNGFFRQGVNEGNELLEPEESESYAVGLQWQPLDALTVSVDRWWVKTDHAIATLGYQTQLNLDAALRAQGSSNPNVIRDSFVSAEDQALFADPLRNPDGRAAVGRLVRVIDPYINADRRNAEGWDISATYRLDTDRLGRFTFRADGMHLSKLELIKDDLVLDRLRFNGNPEWKVTGSVSWEGTRFGASLFARWVSGFLEDTVTQDATGALMPVEDWLTVDAAVDFAVLDSLDLRLGVKNLLDEEAPIADDTNTGYFAEYHNPLGRLYYARVQVTF
jgi:iron complex outermembrane recepter protein